MLFHGNINSTNSVGTNDLIKQGAKMITTYEDIIIWYNSVWKMLDKVQTNMIK